MKLKKIELTGFRNHAHSILDLGEAAFVCVRGANHSGKSSVGQSISMGLTPSTSSLDPQGRGFARKIKRGETKAVITLDIQGKHLIQQTVVLNTNTSGRTSRAVCLDDESWKPLPFENFLVRYKDALLVVSNSDYFLLRMDETRQKALLAKLALPERYDFPPEIIAAVQSAIGEGVIDFNGEPFAVIEKTHKKVYDERAIVNRQVKEFQIPDSLPAVTGVDSESLQKSLEEARLWRQKVNEEKDLAVKAASDTEVKRATLTAKANNLREKCRELKDKIDGLEASVLAPDKLAELQKIVEKSERYTELSNRQAEIQREINEANREIERFSKLSGEGISCPTCDQTITEDYVAKTLKAGKDLIAERVAEDVKIVEELSKIGDVKSAESALAKHVESANKKDQESKTLAEKIKEGKAAVAELNALPAAVDVGAKFAADLAATDAKITGLEEQLRPVIAAEERATEIATKTRAKAKLQEQAESLDKLVEYFGKDGIKSKLLAEHIGSFENKLNATLGAFGYKCAMSIEPYEFSVQLPSGDSCPVNELADSEQLMFSVALQCAVSRVAGIGFIVADRLDTFLPSERVKANRALYTATQDGTLEQVVAIMSDESTEVPKLAGAKFFMAKNGTVTELKSAA